MGGYSLNMGFWWYCHLPATICKRTLCHIQDGRLISINVLEYATILLNCTATIHFWCTQDARTTQDIMYPTVLLLADYKTAEAWTTKGCKASLAGRALGRIQCALMMNCPVGITTDYITTSDNHIADSLSCITKFSITCHLSAFPPKYLAPLLHNGHAVVTTVDQSTHDKRSGTQESRQNCWLQCCARNNTSDPCLLTMPPLDVNFLLATWAINLLRGETVLGQNIQSSTIKAYLQAATKLLRDSGYRHDPIADDNNTHTKQILHRLRWYESIPNRHKRLPDATMAWWVDIKWWVQKNGQCNDVISFWRDTTNNQWRPNRIVFLNTQELETLLHLIASTVTGITDPAILQQLYGLHSIRVTACNELAHQRRLRWHSLTFLDYLRNTVYAAQRHCLLFAIKVSPHDRDLWKNLLPSGKNTSSRAGPQKSPFHNGGTKAS
eukprot:CCRYP_014383-RA/>CCRYP_014383-RA protein AED:0.18 eAED:0.09 QI:59/0/0/1/0/0.25/4/0/437